MRDRLPLILSMTALLVAVLGTPLGEAAYNAVVPKNSVGAQQLRNGAVTNAKLRGDAVTSGKVKNRSLKAIDFAEGQLPAGPPGPKGDKGAPGDPAAVGCPAGTTRVVSVCIENEIRSAKNWSEAGSDCATRQTRLPSAGELFIYGKLPGKTPTPGGEWADFYTHNGTTFGYPYIQGAGVYGLATGSTNTRAYRCVAGLVSGN